MNPNDPNKRYSDPELDPAQRASEEMFESSDPHKTSDGDAVAHDLRRSEEGLGPIQRRLQRRDNKQQALREKEAAQWNAPENRLNYRPPGKEKTTPTARISRRNKFLFGGIGGGIIGMLVLFAGLSPFKVPGLMSLVTDVAGQRLEKATEKRAKIIIGRAILTKFGTHTGIVVTGDGALSSLIASLRTAKFEQKLAAKGLVIQQTAGGVRLVFNGDDMGEFKNERAIVEALDSNKLTNKMLKNIIREEIPAWHWMKRAKFAKWLRIKYGIPRYNLTNSDADTEQERMNEMDAERVRNANTRTLANFRSLIGCLMTGTCKDVDGNTDPSRASADAADTAADGVEEINENVETDVRENGLGINTETTTKTLLKQFATKTIPIIGWIDLVATVDHLAYKAGGDDYFGKIVAYYRGAAYAGIYGERAGNGDQIKLGNMDPIYAGVISDEFTGAEQAQAFQAIQGDSSKGIPIETFVDSDRTSEVSTAFKSFENSKTPFGLQYKYVGHPIMNAYYETIGGGGFLGWLAEGLGGFLSKLLGPIGDIIADHTPEGVKNAILDTLEAIGPKILNLFGLSLDAFERGAKLFNNVFGGGLVSFNEFGKESGFGKFTDEQVAVQAQQIAAEQAEELQQKSLATRLFDTDEPKSLASQFIVNMPSDPASALSSVGQMVMSAPSRLLGTVIPHSSAADNMNYEEMYHIQAYGLTGSQQGEPLSQEFLEGKECPEVPDGEANVCKFDNVTAEAMLCDLEPDTQECSDEDAVTEENTGEDTVFTVASYNILHAGNHTDRSREIGGCDINPVPGDPTCAKTRTAHQVRIITGQTANPRFDIFGTQETSPEQYGLLKNSLPEYDVFPDNPSRMNNDDDGAVAVFWNKKKFTKTGDGKTPGISNTSKRISNPWVELQTTTGVKVYVISVHYAIETFGGTPESIRESSRLTMDWVRSKATGDNIVVVVGDFNDRLRQKLSYCVYTEGSVMQHAVDMNAGAGAGKGCEADRYSGIDHIYATPKLGLEASKWVAMPRSGEAFKASDHSPVYATYVIPGAGKATGDWAWPLEEKWWKTARADFLDAHGMSSGTFTSPYAKGIAVDIGTPPAGSPIFSMLGGKVVREDECAITIESKTSAGTLYIAYAHSTGHKVKVGAQVTAGQQISDLGSTCKSTGAHLHVDMALGTQHICPQDVFLAMDSGAKPDLRALTAKGIAPCGR